MSANDVANTPPQSDAVEISAPVTCPSSSGMTGKMMPIPMESIITVRRMKISARRDCMEIALMETSVAGCAASKA